MDEIIIEDLEIYARHGVYAGEREVGQTFRVSAVLETDTRPAGLTDQLEQSTNYGEVCHFITDWFTSHTYQLIETAAEMTARELLLAFPLVRGVRLEVKKPQAPIGLPFGCVSVRIYRKWHRVYVALGSNIGDREKILNQALTELQECQDVRLLRVSSLINTAPYGGVEQEDFLNGVAELDTLLSPKELLTLLHGIEQNAGRERLIHWGPRTLDLDILLYDRLVYEDEELIIPHVDMQNRDFVLQPMTELAPNLRHPLYGRTMRELLEDLMLREKSGQKEQQSQKE